MGSKKKASKMCEVEVKQTGWQHFLQVVAENKGQALSREDFIEAIPMDISPKTVRDYIRLLVNEKYLKPANGCFLVRKSIPKKGLSLRQLRGQLSTQQKCESASWDGGMLL